MTYPATETAKAVTDFLFIGKKEEELSQYDLVIVCGNEQTDETCSDVLRLMNHVRRDAIIVFSGKNGSLNPGTPPEGERMYRYFVEHNSGYTQTVLVENEAGNTLENFRKSIPLIEQIKPIYSFERCLVVCKAFQTRRAKMCALRCGFPADEKMDFFGTVSGKKIAAENWFTNPDAAKRVMEEVERIGKYFVKGDLALTTVHSMKLKDKPFSAIAAGYKTIEMRLYDEKRRRLNVGDYIEFANADCPGLSITKRIKALHCFLTFEELYSELPLLSCGYTPFTLPYARAEDMLTYYTAEEIAEYGVVGIELEAEPLQRFLAGQAGTMQDCSGYDEALAEIRTGQKETHWIWYVFPQIKGLTTDPVTEYYAVTPEEAKAFLAHPVLGKRLIEITTALLNAEAFDLVSIYSMIDAFKFKASMTLFSVIAPDESVYRQVLEKYCFGEQDSFTLKLLSGEE